MEKSQQQLLFKGIPETPKQCRFFAIDQQVKTLLLKTLHTHEHHKTWTHQVDTDMEASFLLVNFHGGIKFHLVRKEKKAPINCES